MDSTIHIVTASDTVYFTRLCGLVGSIIRKHSVDEYTISVYDIGLKNEEVSFLKRIPCIELCTPEMVNPHILTPIKKHEIGDHRTVPGLYTWKPVAIKMELDKYESIFWTDAGTICINNIRQLIDHIEIEGHFFVGTGTVGWQTPNTLIERLDLSKEILSQQALNAGMMGLSRNVYDNFVLPVYQMAHDISLFVDDGTAHGGPTAGRHDQTILGIQAARNNLYIAPKGLSLELTTHEGNKTASICSNADQVSNDTLIYQCGGNSNFNGDYTWLMQEYD